VNAKSGLMDATSATSIDLVKRHAQATSVLLQTNHTASRKKNHSLTSMLAKLRPISTQTIRQT
jgi:hypothetical protein